MSKILVQWVNVGISALIIIILGYCYEINNNIPLYMENIFSDKWKYGTDENQVGHGVKPEVRL